jgi:pyridoxine 5-phosphate synthase
LNVKPVAKIPQITELNIGHSIIAEAVLEGLPKAVGRMVKLLKR